MLAVWMKANPLLEPFTRAHVRGMHTNFVNYFGDWAWENLPGIYQRARPAVPFETMRVGDEATVEVKTNRWGTWYFAFCTGDFNRVHFDPRGVAPFTGPICHGMHIASLISRVLGTEFPGQGTIFSKMNAMTWHAPVYIGETVNVTLRIEKLEPKRKSDGLNRITFSATVHTAAGVLVLDAEPIAYVR